MSRRLPAKWIPVERELPPENVVVLGSLPRLDGRESVRLVVWKGSEWQFEPGRAAGHDYAQRVTHWMFITQSPQPGQQM